jgi:site-specific DNA recombinase
MRGCRLRPDLAGHDERRSPQRPASARAKPSQASARLSAIDVLVNPAYIGTVAFRDIEAEDSHPRIIERDVFLKADQILTDRAENPAKAAGAASDYHLTGKITCPLCGKSYLGTAARGRNRTYRYYTCYTRNRYGTSHCDAPRIDAERLDNQVLQALGAFYRTSTHLITEAITAAQDDHRAARGAFDGELHTVTMAMAQKETAIDRYFNDYEDGTLDKARLETRIAKLGEEVTKLRHRRDELQLHLDTEPQQIAPGDLTKLSKHIANIIETGSTAERKSLCEVTIAEVRINQKTQTATPVFRVNLAPPTAPEAKKKGSAPAENSAEAHSPCSEGVRERSPLVELRGLEPLTPSMRTRCATRLRYSPLERRQG